MIVIGQFIQDRAEALGFRRLALLIWRVRLRLILWLYADEIASVEIVEEEDEAA